MDPHTEAFGCPPHQFTFPGCWSAGITGSYSWANVGKPHVAAGFTIRHPLAIVHTVLVNTSDRSGTVSTSAPITGLFLTGYVIEGFLVDKKGNHFMVRTDQLQTGDCRV